MPQGWRSRAIKVGPTTVATTPGAGTVPVLTPADARRRLQEQFPGTETDVESPLYEPATTEEFEPPRESAPRRFISGIVDVLNPAPLVDMFVNESGGNPTTFAGNLVKGILGASWDQLKKAKEAYDEDDAADAVRHIGAAIPVIGPVAAHAGERMGSGDVAGGLGEATALLAPFGVKPAANAAMRSAAAERLATAADASATRRMTRVMAPTGQSERNLRMAGRAKEAAPAIAREPGAEAVSRVGLLEKVEPKLSAAADALNAAYETLPLDGVPTKPIIKLLQDKLKEITREGKTDIPIEDATRPNWGPPRAPTSRQIGGRAFDSDVIEGEVVGETPGPPRRPSPAEFGASEVRRTVSAGRTDQANALVDAVREIQRLGDRIDPSDLRRLAGDWGQMAKREFAPSTGPDYLRTRGEGRGWADAEGVLRQHLGDMFPDIRPLNSRYTLLRSAVDAMRAAEEAEQVSKGAGAFPASVRRATERAAGATAGALAGGAGGAVVGFIVGPLIDSALTGGVTLQVGVARAMARFADAVRSGRAAQAEAALMKAQQTTGVKLTGDAWTQVRGWLKRLKESDDTGAVGPFGSKNPVDAMIESLGNMTGDQMRKELTNLGWVNNLPGLSDDELRTLLAVERIKGKRPKVAGEGGTPMPEVKAGEIPPQLLGDEDRIIKGANGQSIEFRHNTGPGGDQVRVSIAQGQENLGIAYGATEIEALTELQKRTHAGILDYFTGRSADLRKWPDNVKVIPIKIRGPRRVQ